jgi:serine/threonine protein kinase
VPPKRKPGQEESTVKVTISESPHEELGLLGRGGMAEVLRVRERSLRRDVALKRVRHDRRDDDADELLVSEARLMARLDHSHVPPVYELGSDDDGPFFTMKVVEGVTFRDWVVGRDPPPLTDLLEQARGETMTERSEVFALGALLYMGLSGRAPYGQRDVDSALEQASRGDWVDLTELGLADPPPPPLLAVVRRTMNRVRAAGTPRRPSWGRPSARSCVGAGCFPSGTTRPARGSSSKGSPGARRSSSCTAWCGCGARAPRAPWWCASSDPGTSSGSWRSSAIGPEAPAWTP